LVFAGSNGHTTPRHDSGTTQLRTDGLSSAIAQEEHSVGFRVGIKVAGFNQSLDQQLGQGALLVKVMLNLGKVSWFWRRQVQEGLSGRWRSWNTREGKVLLQPTQGLGKGQLMEVNDQINGTASALVLMPVEELGSAHGKHAPLGAPFAPIEGIRDGVGDFQDWVQRD
jgi:hypothetical protein